MKDAPKAPGPGAEERPPLARLVQSVLSGERGTVWRGK